MRLKVDFHPSPEADRRMIEFPNIAPEIFTISLFGIDFALRWYALAYLVGLAAGWRIIMMLVRRPAMWPQNSSPMDPARVEDLLGWIVVGTIIGGRLGFVLFYQPAYYLSNPVEILRIWQGGMAFHGGLLGVIVAGILYCKRYKVPMLQISDAMAFVVPIGLFLGRLANFINAELWGRPTHAQWGVAFPGEAAQHCPDIIGVCARHPSQLYEATLEGLLLGLIMLVLVKRFNALKRSGLITGIFFAGYALSRFTVEFFRQPDFQFVTFDNPIGWAIQFGDYGLTMGQILSLPMLAIGVFFLVRARALT
ncbi:MAG: prolipoprotein diacylglyceryl transferase [Paracoccaceae bacterium]|nr:prolipoprotein diacylglyceryl transferase [Paracoccaceae bacterium]MDG1738010.1 prolipoprotein diacylglyceryl transferase [Paracoccaceae bacterium]MDG2259613.1 prolipoprotein diacylglyceryl transferase [Paracoccaceae bacterium]